MQNRSIVEFSYDVNIISEIKIAKCWKKAIFSIFTKFYLENPSYETFSWFWLALRRIIPQFPGINSSCTIEILASFLTLQRRIRKILRE